MAERASVDLRVFGTPERPLALAAFDALRLAGPDLEAQARRYLAERRPALRDEPRPQFQVSMVPGARPPLRVVLAVPDRLVFSESADDLLELGDGGGADSRYLAAELIVAQPDGMVQLVDLTCDLDSCPRAELQALALELATTLAPGPVPLARGPGRRSISMFRFDLLADFVVSEVEGVDYTIWNILRLGPLDAEAADSINLFGDTAFPPLEEPLLAPRTLPGRLLGQPIEWVVTTREGSTSTTLSHDCALTEVLYSFTVHATSEASLAELRRVVESAQVVPNEYVSASDRCVPFVCRTHRYSMIVVRDPRPPLNVRAAPNAQAAVVGTIPNDTEVEVAQRSGAWAHLSTPVDGWAWAGSLIGTCDQ